MPSSQVRLQLACASAPRRATSAEEHDNAIRYGYPMFSKPMTVAEYVGALRGSAVTADSSRGY